MKKGLYNFKYVLFLIILLLNIGIFCKHKQDRFDYNINLLTKKEIDFYRSITSFNNLFKEIKRVQLVTNDDLVLSFMPILGAVNNTGDYIILDNVGRRQILVFDCNARYKNKIGEEGKHLSQFLFPDNLFYSHVENKYYVYDGDLLKILEYNGNYSFSKAFSIPLFLESLIITDDNRLFCYSSGASTNRGADKVIYECDYNGKIIKGFCKQSKLYNTFAESKGGGFIVVGQFIYVITPYEYVIKQYSLDGKFMNSVKGTSSNYISLQGKEYNGEHENMKERRAYHASWSHIRQILKIGNMIGVIFASPGEDKVYLDLYDYNLGRITGDILLPKYIGLYGIYSKDEKIYFLETNDDEEASFSDPQIVTYLLRRPEKS